MTQTILTLGRQPTLGMAELESLYGADKLTWVGTHAALLDIDPSEVVFDRLGGSTRLCRLLTTIPSPHWDKIESYLLDTVVDHLQYVPEGKLKIGLSHIGGGVGARDIGATGLRLKKLIKAEGRSVRLIPNTAPELNAAQIIHNQLTGPTGWELVLIRNDRETILAQTIATQDITAYTARDQKRPKRDARVGMLPPKLAQIIVNLATSSKKPATDTVVLDPFCGTGVVLQEALLMGYGAYGTDLEPRMIEYSEANINWLRTLPSYDITSLACPLQVGDATSHRWSPTPSFVACETYLGRPLSGLPSDSKLQEIIQDCDTIHRKFLRNLANQTKPGFRACVAVPAWKTKTGFKHLKTLESLADLGYNRLRFVHARNDDLIYHRPDQIVARELVILERI